MKRRSPAIEWAIGGAILSLGLCWSYGNRLIAPVPADPTVWAFVINNRVIDGSGEVEPGTLVQSGAMTIRHFSSRGSDIVSPVDSTPLGEVDIALRTGTHRLQGVFRGESGSESILLRLADNGWAVTGRAGSGPKKSSGPWKMVYDKGSWYLDEDGARIHLGQMPPGSVEMTAIDGDVDIESIRLLGATGAPVVDQDYRTVGMDTETLIGAGIIGGSAGMFASVIAPTWLGVGALLLPAWGLLAPQDWLSAMTERMYLADTTPTQLRLILLLSCLLPLIIGAVLGSGVLRVARPNVQREWVKRAVPGLIFLGSWLSAWLGVVYFMLLIASNAAGMPPRRARKAADAFLVLFIALPICLEMLVRSTYLEDAWDSARLAGQSSETADWRDSTPFWQGECGAQSASYQRAVSFMGGSSTGGAYQFFNEPQAFYPAQTQNTMCGLVGPDVDIKALNFGHGGRDSFTVARSVANILVKHPSDVVVFYGGCNDLLQSTNSLTRKEREEAELRAGAGVSAVAEFIGRSRLITGLSLPLHRVEHSAGYYAPEVPLPDAEENLMRLATVAKDAGAKVLLLTEYVSGGNRPLMGTYDAMEEQVASRFDHVKHVNITDLLSPYDQEELLIDRNHFTRKGAERMAQVLAPVLLGMMGVPVTGTLVVPPVAPAGVPGTVPSPGDVPTPGDVPSPGGPPSPDGVPTPGVGPAPSG